MTTRSIIAPDSGGNSDQLACKVVVIGPWNMDGVQTYGATHGLALSAIVSVGGFIQNDAGNERYGISPGKAVSSIYMSPFVSSIDANNVNLAVLTGSYFDSTDFDSEVIDRGMLIIWFKS